MESKGNESKRKKEKKKKSREPKRAATKANGMCALLFLLLLPLWLITIMQQRGQQKNKKERSYKSARKSWNEKRKRKRRDDRFHLVWPAVWQKKKETPSVPEGRLRDFIVYTIYPLLPSLVRLRRPFNLFILCIDLASDLSLGLFLFYLTKGEMAGPFCAFQLVSAAHTDYKRVQYNISHCALRPIISDRKQFPFQRESPILATSQISWRQGGVASLADRVDDSSGLNEPKKTSDSFLLLFLFFFFVVASCVSCVGRVYNTPPRSFCAGFSNGHKSPATILYV